MGGLHALSGPQHGGILPAGCVPHADLRGARRPYGAGPAPGAAAALRRLASEARQAGQVILLEPLSQFESNTCTTAAELAEVLTELNDPCVLPMCDVVASFVQGETAETLYRLTGGAMAHLHIADSDGRSENHLLPGDGVLPLREQLQALRRAGYDGAATIELVSMYTDDPTYYAKCAIERVRELL